MVYGGIMDARKTSELLALQLVANLRGLVPSFIRSKEAGRIEPYDDAGWLAESMAIDSHLEAV
jgi:hypothetical protein